MAIRMRRGNLADFDPTKQLSGEFGVSIDNSAGNQKVFMAFGNGNVKELMTVEDAEAQIGELVDDAVDAAIGDIVDTVTEAAETATTAAQTATTQAGTATTKAGEAASSASSASTDATSAAGSAASAGDSAEDSEAWAVGQRDGQDVPTTDETYHNNAKYWAEQASQAAGGGVTSFNGRSGSVSPQSGDYTAAMVGLGNVDNTSDLNKPISTATQTALNGKADTSALTDGSVTKIGTGNVGSATQPVYIDGGVPTAGKDINDVFKANAVTGSKNMLQNPLKSRTINGITLTVNADKSITLNGTATVRTDFIYDQVLKKGSYIFSTEYSGTGSTTSSWMMYAGAYDLGSPAQFDIQLYFTGESASFERSFNVASDVNMRSRFACINAGTTLNNVTVKNMIRSVYDSDSTYAAPTLTNADISSALESISGITTGTPTNINSKLTLGTYNILKSGNVVNFRIKLTVNTAFTPSESTELFTMPYSSPINNMYFQKQEGTDYGANLKQGSAEMQGAKVIYGSGPWNQLAVNTMILVSGTYLTND